MPARRTPRSHHSSSAWEAPSLESWSKHMQTFDHKSFHPYSNDKNYGMEEDPPQEPTKKKKKKKRHCEKDFIRSRPFLETLQLVCEESTTHGIGHTWNNRYNPLGIFWFLVTLGLLTFLCYSVVTLVMEFNQREVKSQTISLMAQNGLQLPSIALCNRAYFSRKKLKDYKINSDLTSYLVVAAAGTGIMREDYIMTDEGQKYMDDSHNQLLELLAKYNFTMKQLVDAISYDCEEIVLMCSIARRSFKGKECCEKLLSIPTMAGKCYVYFSSHTSENIQRVEGELLGVSLYLSIHNDDHPVLDPKIVDVTQVMKTGLQMSLFSNQTHPSMTSVGHGVAITPKLYTTTEVSLTVVKDNELKTSFDWNIKDCVPLSSIGYLIDLEGFFLTEPNCGIGSIRTCFATLCNCSHYALDIPDDSLQPCAAKDLLRCYTLTFQNMQIQTRTPDFEEFWKQGLDEKDYNDSLQCLSLAEKRCQRPCDRYDYTYTSSRSPINIDIYNNLREEFSLPRGRELSVVTAFFPDMRYTEVRMSRDSISDLISTIGGMTGIMCGVSIVSSIEVIVACSLFFAIFIRFCKGNSISSEIQPPST